MPAPWEDNQIILERGDPHEILPEKLFQWKGLAHRYIREEHPQEAKDRVEAVWLKGENRPAWNEVHKVPDLKLAHRKSPEDEGVNHTDFG